MSRKKIIKSPSLQLPSTAFLSKGTRRFPQSPAPLRRRVQLRGLSPPGVKEGLGGQEAIIRPLLALRRHLPRPVLISVPKYMGSYVSYFIVEIQALHIKFGHIYWNNTPARVRRGKLVIRLGGPTLFLLNGKSSRRCCQGLEVLQRTRKGLSWGRNLLEKHNIMEKNVSFGVRQAWVQIPALALLVVGSWRNGLPHCGLNSFSWMKWVTITTSWWCCEN